MMISSGVGLETAECTSSWSQVEIGSLVFSWNIPYLLCHNDVFPLSNNISVFGVQKAVILALLLIIVDYRYEDISFLMQLISSPHWEERSSFVQSHLWLSFGSPLAIRRPPSLLTTHNSIKPFIRFNSGGGGCAAGPARPPTEIGT